MLDWIPIILALATASAVVEENAVQEIVVVRPKAWSPSIQAWKAHREQQGFRVLEVEHASTAETTRERIRNANPASAAAIQYIVLAGDAPAFFDRDSKTLPNEAIPTFYVESKVVKNFGSEPSIASDYPYADLHQDGLNRIAVGRIPVHSKEELKSYLDKVLAYETSESFQPWRREVDIIAGVGGFGALTDVIVEGATRQLLTDDAEQCQRRARRERDAFARIEPERLTGMTDVDRDRSPKVAVEGLFLHRRAATRTLHGSILPD
jgi:hypothetical protein